MVEQEYQGGINSRVMLAVLAAYVEWGCLSLGAFFLVSFTFNLGDGLILYGILKGPLNPKHITASLSGEVSLTLLNNDFFYKIQFPCIFFWKKCKKKILFIRRTTFFFPSFSQYTILFYCIICRNESAIIC